MSNHGALKAFLAGRRRPDGTLSYDTLRGFLFAVAAAPDPPMHAAWLPMVFGGADARYASPAEARQILDELMDLYNSVTGHVTAGRPPQCRFRTAILDNFNGASTIRQWSQGFVFGHTWLEHHWEGVPKDDRNFTLSLVALSFFSSRMMADTLVAEMGRRDVAEVGTEIRKLFPAAGVVYINIGRSLDATNHRSAIGRLM